MPSDHCAGDIRKDCLDLIRETRVMTLSTCRQTNTDNSHPGVWAAPVYYIFRKNAFYFFSNPRSRHILDGQDCDGAASLFRDADHAEQLRGLQMSGRIEVCPRGKNAAATALAYCSRFGINACKNSHIMDFFNTRFHAQLYRFNPKRLWYMDNRRGMGTRTKVKL